MARETTMVREYNDKASFQADEQHLGMEGWSVQSTVDNTPKRGMVQRIRARFTATPTSARYVVTYSRPKPF